MKLLHPLDVVCPHCKEKSSISEPTRCLSSVYSDDYIHMPFNQCGHVNNRELHPIRDWVWLKTRPKPKLVLIRGLPGSGKSTIAKMLRDEFGFFHVEADMCITNSSGYHFSPDTTRASHEWCYETTRLAMRNGMDVVVANVFSDPACFFKYFAPVNGLQPDFKILEARGEYRSVHNIPSGYIESLKSTWDQVSDELRNGRI